MFPKRFLFNFSFPCRHVKELWRGDRAPLDETYRLPVIDGLDADENASHSDQVDLRIAWNSKGLAFVVIVCGKKQSPWSRQTQPEESDGLQLCLDTRDVRNVHRATRFCHRLILLPGGPGAREEKAAAIWVPIHRAKNHPNPVSVGRITVKSSFSADGYRLDAMIPADVLTGFEPEEYPRLGFHYVLADREIGPRFLALGPPFPHDQDPSLWPTLELIPG
ncbi:MAG TPA: hypothetical protein DEB39_11370 [Planctomycetaceae bacterium]|nr:hypothetical protein [Planctomycetaceae bacterium]